MIAAALLLQHSVNYEEHSEYPIDLSVLNFSGP